MNKKDKVKVVREIEGHEHLYTCVGEVAKVDEEKVIVRFLQYKNCIGVQNIVMFVDDVEVVPNDTKLSFIYPSILTES